MAEASNAIPQPMDREAQPVNHIDPPWEGETTTAPKSSFLSKIGIPTRKPVATASAPAPISNHSTSGDETREMHNLKEEGVTVAPTATSSTTGAAEYYAPPPEYKEEAGIHAVGTGKPTLRDRFNAMIPPHRRYLGRSRRTFIIIILVLFLCLLALIIGLAAGLSHKKSSSPQNLPLPTNKGIFTGDLTYYGNELGLGACGTLSAATDNICAVSHLLYDAASTGSNPNANPLCGQMIRVTRYDSTIGSNRSVDVKVIDRCVGCKATDLDLSIGAFEKVAEEAEGRVVGSWAWLT